MFDISESVKTGQVNRSVMTCVKVSGPVSALSLLQLYTPQWATWPPPHNKSSRSLQINGLSGPGRDFSVFLVAAQAEIWIFLINYGSWVDLPTVTALTLPLLTRKTLKTKCERGDTYKVQTTTRPGLREMRGNKKNI